VQGTQGIQGAQSVQGVQGIQGVQGLQGIQGVSGSQGIQGVQGSDATVQGIQGSTGIQGVQGLLGTQGIQGTIGVQGQTGPQGYTGNTGNVGQTGAQGAIGSQGSTGAGTQGIQGIQGNTGTGTQGAQGIQGAGANINTGSFITTGSVGTKQTILGSLGLTTIDNISAETLPLVDQGGSGTTLFIDYSAYSNPEWGYWNNTNWAGVLVNGPGVTNATVTGTNFTSVEEIFLSAGTVTSGGTYTFTGPLSTDLIVSASILMNGNILQTGNGTVEHNIALDSTFAGTQFAKFNAFVDSFNYSDTFGGLRVIDAANSYFNVLETVGSTYTTDFPNEIVGLIAGGGNNTNGNNEALIFRTGSADMLVYKPTTFKFNTTTI
jgi:hypothetical protein